MKRVGWGLVFASLAFAVPAKAEYSSPMHLDKWQVVQLGQCKAILNMGAFRLDPSGRKEENGWDIKKTEWTGACDASGYITGAGVIRLYTWIQEPDGRYFTNYYVEYRVTAAAGMLDGPVTMATANYDDRRGGYEAAQVWTEEPEYRRRFDRGCLIDEWQETGCDPAVGQRFLAQFLGPRAATPAPRPSPAPLTAAPVVAAPLTAGPAGKSGNAGEVVKLVSNSLLQVLGGNGSAGFGTKQDMISSVLANLATALGGSASPLAGNDGLADAILGMVAGQLSRSDGNQTTGQIIDLVNRAINSVMQDGAPSPAPAAMAVAPLIAATPGGAGDFVALDSASLIQAFARIGKTLVPNGGEANYSWYKEADNRFSVQTHCPSGGACKAIVFKACYTFPNASIGRANAFNRERLHMRAFLTDNGNLCLDEVVRAEGGSVSFENFKSAFEVFEAETVSARDRFNSP